MIPSFRGLASLRSLDLSRNRLRSVPPQSFSYLAWLGSLNLDMNTWNCTCELRELAAFLSSYMEAPDKVTRMRSRLGLRMRWRVGLRMRLRVGLRMRLKVGLRMIWVGLRDEVDDEVKMIPLPPAGALQRASPGVCER